jgi:hypothetical protein
LGGGGYEISVMPRAWTLAYGIMSNREFPDDLPPAYAAKYGSGTLHDQHKPRPDPRSQDVARRHASLAISELKERIAGLRG